MSKYHEGQKVFAYVVVGVDGPSVLADGSDGIGKILIERTGKGPAHTYNWYSEDHAGFTHWHAKKAGRGFFRDGTVVWDESTKSAISRLTGAA
ncbi:hypothetical protein D9M72_588130 [compost metagenome]